jgi:hypothetical protein
MHIVVLSVLATLLWLADGWNQVPWPICLLIDSPACNKFALFRQTIIAGSAAGLGGAIFAAKRFAFMFGKGVDTLKPLDSSKNKNEWLKRGDIPWFFAIPITSVVIGPIALALMKSGTIVFSGLSGTKQVPTATVIAVSFILGLAYYDTLHWFCEWSKRILGGEKKASGGPPQNGDGRKDGNSQDSA